MIKRSIFGLRAAAFSTLSRMRCTMLSASMWVTRSLIAPSVLTQPEVALSPAATRTGTGSPVTAEVSRRLSPSTTSPSSGTRSPGRTRTMSPSCASSAGITSISPFVLDQIYRLGTQVDRVHDLLARTVNRTILKVFADAVEQHNADRLVERADRPCTDGCNGHQEVFVKYLTAADVLDSRQQDMAAEQQVSRDEQH